jgi:transposase
MLAFLDPETRVPPGHPLRPIRRLADAALVELSPLFDRMYAEVGRPSIPPERLLKASLLIALYRVPSGRRSERAFCEELDHNILYRWFLGMDLVEPSFDPTSFTKNRARLLPHRVARAFFDVVVWHAQQRRLLSDEHFTVDGTLIEAAASLKSLKRTGGADGPPAPPADPGHPRVNFRGEKRSNATHASASARVVRAAPGRARSCPGGGHAGATRPATRRP